MSHEPYSVIPAEILDGGLSNGAFRLWCYLAPIYPDVPTPRDISIKTMASDLHKSESTIRRHLSELLEFGFIEQQTEIGQPTLTHVLYREITP